MRRISITTRLLSYLVLAGIVPLLLLGTSAFEISRRIIIKQAGEFHLQQVNDLQAYLSLYSDQVESLAANVAGNEAIGAALRAGSQVDNLNTDTYSALITQAQIGYILNGYVRVKGLVSIDLFSRDGKHFHVGDTLDVRDVDAARVNQMLIQAGESVAPVYWRGIEDNLNRASTQSKVMTVTRVIRYYVPQAGTTEVVGLLVINIDANLVINEFLSAVKTPEHLRLMLLDRNGRFGYHSNPALLGQSATLGLIDLVKSGPPIQEVKLDGQEAILGVVPFDRIGGRLIGVLPHSILTAPTSALIYASLVLLLIGIAAISLLAWRFVRHVVVPVRDVSEGFGRLQEHPDNPPSALPLPDTRDEMADLVLGFNRHLDVLASQQLASHQLLEAQRAAEAASRAKSQFLATMSHEIRTPMNGILGMAQLLLMSDLTEQERLEYARTILNSGETLLTLLNDILDLSKVEAGKLELQCSAFDPRQLIGETAALFREPIESKGLRLENKWRGPGDIRYWGDALRLRQMLSNLVSNAAKFTSRGVIRIEGSEVEQKDDGALLEFAVTDSGVGIPKDKLNQLFKPFSQVDGSITRQYGGSGLGLSIVANMARMMDGDTGIDSEPDRGSRVWFRVWVALAPIDQNSRQGDRAAIVERVLDAAQLGAIFVLIVEDNLTNRKVIEGLLRKQGVNFQSVENGFEAVKQVTGGSRPALIMMDCQMPVMDGFEATEHIREWEIQNSKPKIPIVALTAGAFQEDRDKCIAAGMDDFLAKPLRLPDLQAALRKWYKASQDIEPG